MTDTSAGRPRCASPRAGHEVSIVDNFSRRRWHTELSTDSLTPIALARRPDRGLARGLGQRDPAVRRLDRGLRLPRRGDRRDPARGDRPLRRAALGAVLDEVARGRGRDPVHERDRHPQPAVRDPRPGARLPPGQARDDGRVRDPEHRHRGGVHRDRAQRPQGHAAVPEAAGLALPPLEGPRLPQHPLRLPDLGPARDRPQPGRRLRDRDRGVGRRRAPGHPLRLRRVLRHRAQPLLRPGGDRPPADRLRRGRPDARLPQHPRHAPVRRARGRQPGRPGRVPGLQPVHRAVLGRRARRAGPAAGGRDRARGRGRAGTRTRGSRPSSTTTTRPTRSSTTSGSSRTTSARSWSARCSGSSSATATG